MNPPGRAAFRDLLLLSFIAGSADAAGFLGLGQVFTSNMTGNVVLLGIAVGQGHFHDAIHTGYVVLVFMTGTLAGAWMSHRVKERTWSFLAVKVISVEAGLLGVFAVLWYLFSGTERMGHPYYLVTLLALAMGLQAAAMNRLGIPGVGTTAITGTLTNLAGGVIRKLGRPPGHSGTKPDRPVRVGFKALVVCAYCGGAILNGALMPHHREWVGLIPALLLLFIVVHRGLAHRRAG